MLCPQCSNPIIGEPVNGRFCSKQCLFTYMQSQTLAKRNKTTQPQENNSTNDDADYTTGESWKRAGIKYEEMTRQALITEFRETSKRSIIIGGNGASLMVRNNKLVVKYGVSYEPQELLSEELDRATHGVYRIVWCGATGNINYAAMKWCQEQSIDVVVTDRYGSIVSESNNNPNINIRVKRAQYNLSPERTREIAMWIILGKVRCQYETYLTTPELHNYQTTKAFGRAMDLLSSDRLRTIDEIRTCEMNVADFYFRAWHDVSLHWNRNDIPKIPTHWQIVGNRNGMLTTNSNPRKPISPAMAILNYAYGILEHQTHSAITAVGLDAAVGILHADRTGRDSLIYDLIESSRGLVDKRVLNLIRHTEFRGGEFTQTVDGSAVLHPELAGAVAATCCIDRLILLEQAQILKAMIVGNTPIEATMIQSQT